MNPPKQDMSLDKRVREWMESERGQNYVNNSKLDDVCLDGQFDLEELAEQCFSLGKQEGYAIGLTETGLVNADKLEDAYEKGLQEGLQEAVNNLKNK